MQPERAGGVHLLRVSITNPEGEDFVVLVDGESAVIGRSPEVDITVPNPLVSGRHLRVDAGAIVRDLQSKNGSWSQGARLAGPTLVGENTIILGPDAKRSPTVRVDVISAAEMPSAELDGEQTIAVGPDGNGAVRVIRTRNGNAPALPAVGGQHEATMAHPLLRSAPVRQNGASTGSQEFVVDACLQSMRSLEDVMTPTGRSSGESWSEGLRSGSGSEIRDAAENALAKGADPGARQELVEALDQQRRRILDRYYAYRRASTTLVEELRDGALAESNVSGNGAIPLWKKLLGMRWRILWTRSRAHLESHGRARIENRLDELARAASGDDESDFR